MLVYVLTFELCHAFVFRTVIHSVAEAAAELMEPKAQFVKLPNRTLKTDQDIDAWLAEVKQTLKESLAKGPVIVR